MDTRKLKFKLSRLLSYPLVPPQYFMLEITDYCNLKCVMCASNRCIGHIDFNTLKDLFAQINNFSQESKIIQLTGGEPLLHPQFRQISNYIKEDPNIFHLSSNGILIDNFMEELVNFDLLNISIDGFQEGNDLVRGKGAFARITGNLKKLFSFINSKGIRLEVCFNILITKYNYENLHKLVEYLYSIFPYAKFQLLNVAKSNSQSDLGLDGDLGRIDNPLKLIDEIAKIKGFCQSKNCVFFYPEGYLDYLSTNSYSSWRCYAGYNRLSISANGDMWICNSSLGNVNDKQLKKMWYSKEARNFRNKVKLCKNYCFQDCYRYKNI